MNGGTLSIKARRVSSVVLPLTPSVSPRLIVYRLCRSTRLLRSPFFCCSSVFVSPCNLFVSHWFVFTLFRYPSAAGAYADTSSAIGAVSPSDRLRFPSPASHILEPVRFCCYLPVLAHAHIAETSSAPPSNTRAEKNEIHPSSPRRLAPPLIVLYVYPGCRVIEYMFAFGVECRIRFCCFRVVFALFSSW